MSEMTEEQETPIAIECLANPQDVSLTRVLRVAFSMFDRCEFVELEEQEEEEDQPEDAEVKLPAIKPLHLELPSEGDVLLSQLYRQPIGVHLFYQEEVKAAAKGKPVKKKESPPQYLGSDVLDLTAVLEGSRSMVKDVSVAISEDHVLRTEYGCGDSVVVTASATLPEPLVAENDVGKLIVLNLDTVGVFSLPEAIQETNYEYTVQYVLPGVDVPIVAAKATLELQKEATPYATADDTITVRRDRELRAEQQESYLTFPETLTVSYGKGIPDSEIPNKKTAVVLTPAARDAIVEALKAQPDALDSPIRADLVRLWLGKGEDPDSKHASTVAHMGMETLLVPGRTAAEVRSYLVTAEEEVDLGDAEKTKRPSSKKSGKPKGEQKAGHPFVQAHTYIKTAVTSDIPFVAVPTPVPFPENDITEAAETMKEAHGATPNPDSVFARYRTEIRALLRDTAADLVKFKEAASPLESLREHEIYPKVVEVMKAALLDVAAAYAASCATRTEITAELHTRLMKETSAVVEEIAGVVTVPDPPSIDPVDRIEAMVLDSEVLGRRKTAIALMERRLVIRRDEEGLMKYARLLLEARSSDQAFEVIKEIAQITEGETRLRQHLTLGALCVQKENIARASEYWNDAADLDDSLDNPTHGLPHALLGALLALSGRDEDAQPLFLRAMQIRGVEPPEDVPTDEFITMAEGGIVALQLDCADSLIDMCVPAVALRILLRLPEIDSINEEIYSATTVPVNPFEATITASVRHKILTAAAHLGCGRHQQAVTHAKAALADADNVAIAWKLLGQAELSLGKTEEGTQAFRAALRQASLPGQEYVAADPWFLQTTASLLLTRTRPPATLLPADIVQASNIRLGSAPSRSKSRATGRLSVRDLRDLKRRQTAPATSDQALTPKEAIDNAFNVLRYTCTEYPMLSTPWAILGRVLMMRGDYETARHAMEHANLLNSSNGAVWGQTALLLLVDGDREAADRCVGIALQNGLRDPNLILDLAEIYHIHGDHSIAEGLLLRAMGGPVQPAPQPLRRAQTIMAESLRSRGALEQCVTYYKAALEGMEPSTTKNDLLEHLTATLMELGRGEEAKALMNE
ncbi:TPR domain protein [Carpediemonas membranifera]|uniref:TPR domain protein n=1 Tax=Carpediemonas membranifera TaxID=201153 RepID=A0A8J6BBI6_9EUKA|nr:TPR domain protein [Carpediemonas membranifera]|eukprot:KAG9396827.1 TPR domain protein [Carpediemonas membranifera]